MNKLNFIIFTFISLIVIDGIYLINVVGSYHFGLGTYVSLILIYISIIIYIYIAKTEGFVTGIIPTSIKNLFIIWMLWNILNLIRGAYLSVDYWDWKTLFFSSISFSLIPLTFFFGKNIQIAKNIFRIAIKYFFLYGFLLIPITLITNPELYSRLMIPVSLFILFIPFFKLKWKMLIILVAATSILLAIEFRSNVIKISFSIAIMFIYYFRSYINQNWLRFAHLFLFTLPIILFIFAIYNKYNVFEEISSSEDEYNITNGQGEQESLMADTRTFIYVEVLSSLNNSGNMLIGEGATGKYQSDYFDYLGDNRGRYGSEVGILNILLYNGIIGVLIYFLLLFIVSFIAINRSNNILAKMLGLYISFRWTYSFIEEYTDYNLNFYFFWITIGLVSSFRFRNLNNKEITKYLELQ